jgi:LysM repeat protein
MKPTTPRRTRRLLARAATMNHAAEEFDDYGPEPNMKLSHAFLVVLLLHVVAVGGLYLFNSMKAGHQIAKAGMAAKTSPSQGSPNSSSGDRNTGPKGPDGEKPPVESKTSPVAKTTEGAGQETTTRASTEKTGGTHKSLFANAKGFIGKITGMVSVSAGAAKVSAQDAPAEVVTNSVTTTTTEGSVATAPGEGKTYTVKAGDTLTRIAATVGVSIPELEKANGLASNSALHLQVGQILKVPFSAQAAASVTSEAAASAAVPATASNPVVVAAAQGAPTGESVPTTDYTVVKGDNPWKIAKKFKISQDELMKANGITDPKKIQIGQVLKIPVSSTKAPKAKQ